MLHEIDKTTLKTPIHITVVLCRCMHILMMIIIMCHILPISLKCIFDHLRISSKQFLFVLSTLTIVSTVLQNWNILYQPSFMEIHPSISICEKITGIFVYSFPRERESAFHTITKYPGIYVNCVQVGVKRA